MASLLLYYFSTPYQLDIQEDFSHNRSTFMFFKDLDQDGLSEWIQITEQNPQVITFFDHKRRYIEEFPIVGKLQIDWIIFHDYNHDGWLDVFLFTISDNTLLLSGIDLSQKKYLFKGTIIDTLPPTVDRLNWDIRRIGGKFAKINDDETKDFVFFITAGYALYPRKIYIFDVANQKILATYSSTVFFNDLNIVDLDLDEEPEIIVTSNAPGNIHSQVQFTDHKTWLMIFDKYLNFKISPRSFSSYPGSLTQLLAYEGHSPVVYLFSSSQSKNNEGFSIKKMNKDFSYSKEIFFNKGFVSDPLVIKDGSQSFLLIPVFSKKTYYKFDLNLNLVEIYKLPSKMLYIMSVFYNDQSEPFFLMQIGQFLVICDKNFNQLTRTKFLVASKVSIQFNNNSMPDKIMESTGNRTRIYKLNNSPVRKYWFLIFPLLFIPLYLFILGLKKLLLERLILGHIEHYYMNLSNSAICLFRKNGQVVHVNNLFQKLFIGKPHVDTGITFKSIFEKSLLYSQLIFPAFEKKDELTIKINKSDQLFSREGNLTIIPIKIFRKYPYYILVIFEESSSVALPPRLKDWTTVIQKLAHDIKTPLSTLHLKFSALKQKSRDNNLTDYEKEFDILIKEFKRIKEITNHFIKFSSFIEITPKFIEITTMVDELQMLFREYLNNGITLNFSIEPGLKHIYADEEQLLTAFQNIVQNSIDAMNNHGTVLINFQKEDDPLKLNNSIIAIEIVDTGPGIPEEIMDKLFEPFMTTKPQGTGIGLFLTKKIIEGHGGEIFVSSRPSLGTTFTIKLPFNNNGGIQ